MDSVGRAKWKEFKGRSQFRVIARYANIIQTVADGTKQIPRTSDVQCGTGWAGGGGTWSSSVLAGCGHLTARSTKGCRERMQPKGGWRHEMDLHGEARLRPK